MNNRILLSVAHMGGTEQKWIQKAFDDNWITPLGPNVNEFESTGATSLNSSFSLLSLIERIKESSRTTKTRVKALFLAGILTLTLTMT